MSRSNKLGSLVKSLFAKKSKNKSNIKDKDGNILSETAIEEVTIGNETLNASASKTVCYVVQDDLLLIGTRAELETKLKKKVGILELESETKAKLEASTKIINETFKKGLEASAELGVKNKSEAKLGKHIKGEFETEAKVDATATAIIDLTKLMVELGVDVNASLKIEGSVSLDLKVIDIKAFMSAALDANASAKASISYKGILAEAQANVEAKATMGIEATSKPFSVGETNVKITLKPSITAYARAEAKAAAAVGLKTGVSIGATAAVGLRGTIEAILNGNYTVKEGLDEFNRVLDPKTGLSKPAPDVSDKDLGAASLELSLELSVGAEFSATPFDFSIKKENGFDYAVGEGNIDVNIPGLISGPAGVGVGIKVYIKILNEIVNDIIKALKDAIKDFIISVVGKMLVEQFEKFKKEVALLAEKITDLGVDAITSLLDFVGKDLNAIDVKIKRLDNRLFAINAKYMNNITIFNKDPNNAENNKEMAENKAKLEEEFEEYNVYVEKAFSIQQTKINKIISQSELRVTAINQRNTEKTSDEIKAFKKAASKTNDTIKRMKKLINTKNGIIVYVGPNRKVLKLKPSILSNTEANLEDMKDTLKSLEEFASTIA